MPATPAMPARARSSGPTRSAGRSGSARSTIRARHASSTAVSMRDPFPNNQVPRAVWDAGRAQHHRAGALGRAGARPPVQQPAGAGDLLSGVRAEHVRDETRPGDQHPAQGLLLPEPRVADPQQLARRTLRSAARVADESVPAAGHSELDDQGVGELGDQRSAAASLRVRLQPLRERKPERLFQPGLALEDRPEQPAGHDLPAVRLRRHRRRSWATLGNFGSDLARRELRGQHDRSGRSDLRHRAPQHQDRLRGALLLRRQRNRRRDGHLQLQLGADEPAGIRSADRPCLRELSPRRGRRRPAVRSRRSTRTTSSAISASTCRTTSRSPPSSR